MIILRGLPGNEEHGSTWTLNIVIMMFSLSDVPDNFLCLKFPENTQLAN